MKMHGISKMRYYKAMLLIINFIKKLCERLGVCPFYKTTGGTRRISLTGVQQA